MAATEWVGNSVQVATKHYLRTTADDFKRASDFAPVTAQTGANTQEVCTHDTPMPSTERTVNHGKPNKKRASGQNPETREVDDIGLETNCGTALLATGYAEQPELAESLHPRMHPENANPDLQGLIDAWPLLSETTKRKILRDVQKALK